MKQEKIESIGFTIKHLKSGKLSHWGLYLITREDGTNYFKLIEYTNKNRVDYPIYHHADSITYDRPEIIPKYIKKFVSKTFKKFRAIHLTLH